MHMFYFGLETSESGCGIQENIPYYTVRMFWSDTTRCWTWPKVFQTFCNITSPVKHPGMLHWKTFNKICQKTFWWICHINFFASMQFVNLLHCWMFSHTFEPWFYLNGEIQKYEKQIVKVGAQIKIFNFLIHEFIAGCVHLHLTKKMCKTHGW